LVLVPLAANVATPQSVPAEAWGPWHFLIGKWTAEGHGEPGEGRGTFEFALELQGHILVRRSRLAFPATAQRAAFSHDDLLIVYPEGGAESHRAIYFDSEGHVIQYTTAFSDGGKTLTFTSEARDGTPRQRLTYQQIEDGLVRVKFEIAPPGKPEGFVTHVEGTAHRQ
jgi:hypothetical protein